MVNIKACLLGPVHLKAPAKQVRKDRWDKVQFLQKWFFGKLDPFSIQFKEIEHLFHLLNQ